MCGSRKYPYPPRGWSLEIPRGWEWGVSKPNIFKGEYKAKPDFPKRWGVQTKNHPRWGYGHFLEPHNIKTSQKLT